ncbi:MAG: hypothetical protein ACTSW1_16225 [Candidatus Hodarchaeales archaeon]
MKILQPNYKEERNSKYLLVWRDIPHWMIVDEEAYKVIQFWNKYQSIKRMVSELNPCNDAERIQKQNELKQFLGTLKKIGIAYEGKPDLNPAPFNTLIKTENNLIASFLLLIGIISLFIYLKYFYSVLVKRTAET